MNEFIKNFANQFDDTDLSEFKPETVMKDLDEWSSLTNLAVMNMIGKKYGVIIKIDEFHDLSTIQDLFDLVKSKSK